MKDFYYLVTGGAGFIGSHLVERLLNDQMKVVVLDNLDSFYDPEIKRTNLIPFYQNTNFQFIEGDIRDKKLLREIFHRWEIKAVVHLAARAGVRTSIEQPLLYEQINVQGTLNLLEICREQSLKKFIFASSSSVYGDRGDVPFKEHSGVCQPISPYGVTKYTGELLCYVYHHLYGIPTISLRIFTCYGPRQRPEMAIHKFARLIAQNKEITIYGSGDSTRDYTYISDLIEGIMRALKSPVTLGVYNLGGSRTVKLSFLVSLIEKGLSRRARICYLAEQPGDVPSTWADISDAGRELGYQPKVGIEEGISRFIQWYRRCNPCSHA